MIHLKATTDNETQSLITKHIHNASLASLSHFLLIFPANNERMNNEHIS